VKILFEITNCDSHINMYDPVIKVLRESCPECVVHILSLCEVQGRHTNLDVITPITRNVHQPYRIAFDTESRGGMMGKLGSKLSYLRMLWMKHKVANDMDRFVKLLQPDVIMFPNDRITPHIPLIKAAKKGNVPTILIQESIRKDDSYTLSRADRAMALLIRHLLGVEIGLLYHGQGGCDRIAAWGETSLQYFKRIGVSEKKVVLTGNPRIESIANEDWQTRSRELRETYSIPKDASVVTLATNPVDAMGMLTDEELRSSVSMVTDAIALSDDVHLFLKPHRSEDLGKYKQVIAKSKSREDIYLVPDVELYPLLYLSDAVMLFNSTVALEAAVLGTPVAVINPFRVDMGIDFADTGLAIEIHNKEELIHFLESSKHGEMQIANDVIQKYFATIDGAADKIASEILKMADRK